ncbi:MAG: hypothetical protein ACOC20_01845 [Oceanicaulis sp.]
MTLLDPGVIADAFRFPFRNARLVAAGAGLYAVVFAVQTVITAYAAAGVGWAAMAAVVTVLAAFAAFVVALAAWGRVALQRGSAALGLGGDEGRLLWVCVLVLILVFTVIGTAFLALAFMLAGLALINVDAAQEPPEGFVNIFALYGTGELFVAIALGAVFVLFSLWFFLRLALAYPATVDQGRVQVLTAWPLSGRRRAVEMIVTLVLAAAPGVAVLIGFNVLSDALVGAWPGAAQSAVQGPTGEGAMSVSPIAFAFVALIYGAAKMALVAAPCAAALCALYLKYRAADQAAGEGGVEA